MLAVASAGAETLPAKSEALIFKLEVFEADVLKKAAERRSALRVSAVEALKKRLGEAMEGGQLDAAIALRSVIGGLESDEALPVLAKTENLPSGIDAQLTALHRAEVEADSAAAKEVREKTLQVVKLLDLHVVEATKAGELDAAAALRKKVEAMRPEEVAEAGKRPFFGDDTPAAGVLPLDTRLVKGLVAYEFEKLEKQKDDDTRGVHYGEFGKAVTKRKIAKGVRKWKWNQDRNAVAIGYIKIEEAGEYSFTTYNWWDRNALYVLDLDKPLCPYRDHGKQHTIQLEPGYVPIVAVGYPEAKGDFGYAGWKRPGAEKHEGIPEDLLFHSRMAAEEIIRKIEEGGAEQ